MLTEESFLLAWLVYALAAAGILLCFQLWWLGRLGGPARLSLLLALAVIMLLPARTAEELPTLAPVIVIAGFDLLTHGLEAALQSARVLIYAVLAALLPGLVWAFLRRRQASPQSAEGA